ncbi:hypothetical protein GGX14DRAFT_555814 [Mycena pura]|uniref:Uncharacterized protein n=1 Tax=Mycena pura TaxID=153505 RepID=A0AAD6YRJ8_9AGAR|nr:hypothetical protein GGX14DRAFT_555814 [Mycena pura]
MSTPRRQPLPPSIISNGPLAARHPPPAYHRSPPAYRRPPPAYRRLSFSDGCGILAVPRPASPKAHSPLPLFATRRLLLPVAQSLLHPTCSLPAANFPLRVARCSLPVTCCC